MNPPQEVPEEWLRQVDEPPPLISGEKLTPGIKYILLVAGDLVASKALVDMGPPVSGIPNPMYAYYEVVPESQVPPGKQPVLRYSPAPWMAAAWKALIARYTSQDFIDDGWQLAAIHATSAASVDAALAELQKTRPTALVVHYFNHGDSLKTGGIINRGRSEPYLAIRTENWVKMPLRDPSGATQIYDLLVPNPNVVSRYYTRNLARKLQADFSNIPLLLILDGCELAPSLDYATARLPIVVSVDRALCGSNLGLFSLLFAGPVIPADFDRPRASLPGALAAVNATLITNTVSYVDTTYWSLFTSSVFGVSNPVMQRASMTKWHWP
ncbi:MAG: hypothetical protein EXS39_02100 [Opitutaceae bacterium]|nr:hypothetical protein [Opitutaceae bacterium]